LAAKTFASEESQFSDFIAHLAPSLGRKDREVMLRDYCAGLISPCERKSMEPIAAMATVESGVSVQTMHQRIHHFVSNSQWDGQALIQSAMEYARPAFHKHGGVSALIVDDTGFPKKGTQSVGVSRQYCGRLGKQDNCQVAVSLHMACTEFAMPISWRLFVPETWANEKARMERAGVPQEFARHQSKPMIALDLLTKALGDGCVQKAPVLADAGYGHSSEFRDGLDDLGLMYAVAVQGSTTVRIQADADAKANSIAVENIYTKADSALVKPRKIVFRDGAKGAMSGRFAALRVTVAHKGKARQTRQSQWLLLEWEGQDERPSKFHLSNLPETTKLQELASLVHLRFRIEQDYGHLKDDLGLDHFEGRSWNGFHHHLALCSAAYAYLITRRGRFSPCAIRAVTRLKKPALPQDYLPRGTPAARKM
jgi:SRSO17 transposase